MGTTSSIPDHKIVVHNTTQGVRATFLLFDIGVQVFTKPPFNLYNVDKAQDFPSMKVTRWMWDSSISKWATTGTLWHPP